jgi:hypothetical protein
MLTSLLLVLCLPLQDAPAPAPAPAANPPAAAQEAAVPAETPENVRKFLVDAEAHLYDPQTAGLSSIEFDVAIDHPQYGSLGSAHVTWSTSGTANVVVTPAQDARLPAQLVELVGQQIGTQLLGAMLNKPITPLLKDSVASMGGVDAGLVKVSFHNEAAMAQGLKEQSLFFDDEGMLQRMHVVQDMQGTKVSTDQSFQWRPVAEGKELYVAASQHSETTAETPMGPMKIPGDTSFTYVTVGEIVLPTSIATSQEVPVQGKVTQTLAATNLKVNGQPVGG